MYKNSTVNHNTFGKGKVIGIVNGSNCRFIKVKFKSKEAQFKFPEAFEKHLRFEDENLQAAVMAELRGETPSQETVQQNKSYAGSNSDDMVPVITKSSQRSSRKAGDAKTGVYILNFQGPITYDELLWVYQENNKKTNLEELLEDAKVGSTGWSVPTYAEVGDTILFMVASSSIDTYHMNGAVNEAAALSDWEVYDFGREEREKYRKYAGKIICVGKIKGFPHEGGSNEEYNQRLIIAEVGGLQMLETPVAFQEFRDFIKINRFGSVTGVKHDQWVRLKELVVTKNPYVNL